MEKKAGKISAPCNRDGHARDHGLKALVGLGTRAAMADDKNSESCLLALLMVCFSQQERKWWIAWGRDAQCRCT